MDRPQLGDHEIAELLARAASDPSGALRTATALLDSTAARDRIVLLRVMGNACRELRQVTVSTDHLRRAVDEAVAIGDARLEGLSAKSLAATLSYAGQFEESLTLVERSVTLLEGAERLDALGQRAGLLARAGRGAEALGAFTDALAATEVSTDPVISGNLWVNRGVLHGWAGDIDAAEADTCCALEVFERLGHTKRVADLRHNLAWLAGRRGDLVEAFRRFDDAEAVYESLGLTGAAVFPDRCEALLAAGLTAEALGLAERSVAGLTTTGDDVDLAEASMLVARAALLAGDHERAITASAAAAERFARQDRGGWWAAATSLLVEARVNAGCADDDDVAVIDRVIVETASSGLTAASAEAHVVAAELAAELGAWPDVARHLDNVERNELTLATRCRHDLARVRSLAEAGHHDLAIEACARAVDEFAALSAALGGTELRAHIALHVAALVELGTALAVRAGHPPVVLAWSERQRASALTAPPVLPPEDHELASDLDRLRSALTALDAKARDGVVDDALAGTCASLQDRVRRRGRLQVGPTTATSSAWPTIDDLGDLAVWVSLLDGDDELLALRVSGGKADVVSLGSIGAARREASLLRSTLAMHLSALGRGIDKDPGIVTASAEEADALLLEPLDLPPGPVAISTVAGLHDLPWALLPSLHTRPFVLAPSLALWRRCRAVVAAGANRAVAVAGPDLAMASSEAERVGRCYPSATVISGSSATVAEVGAALRGVDVAHLVCHGRFSVENPMFSSLSMADGPMFVYDLERLTPPPRIIVLSACHAGSHATPAGQEILGLTASLLARGPRAVIASTVAIPDTAATVELMARLHTALAAGAGAADALVEVRAADPITGGALACYGAG